MDKPRNDQRDRIERPDIGRRTFLKVTGTAAAAASTGVAGILESGRAPAWAQAKKLHLLHWVDFVPAGDEELTRQVAEAGKALGAEITLERINANDLQARITAAIESGSGPDIIQMLHNWSHLYQRALVDVSDLAAWKEKDQGSYYELSKQAALVGGKYLGLPYGVVGNAVVYRRDLFEEVGEKAPKTWEENRRIGKKLKAKGFPFGQTLGHTFGDAPTFSYPYLWSWGGKEVEKDGKKVAINSTQTVESVKFLVAMWKDAYDEGGLAWDDTNNNRAFLSGTISATLNGASIYIESKRKPDQYKTDKGDQMWKHLDHFPLPGGPAGQFSYHAPFAHSIMKYSKSQPLARDFLKWLHSKEQFGKWFQIEAGYSVGSNKSWEQHPMWERLDPPMKPYRTASGFARGFGYAGPFSAKATEVYSKYVVTDMYAKAVQGMAAEESVKWAEGELKKVYG
ncbi:MAG: extracellular solute-binding protein [Candidatus Rokubacteria bacterium]|nr:extracellular solute-binding protein [Candidatus Rokubacteria bacterium]